MTGKGADFNEAYFYESLMYLQCLHYRTTNLLRKKFQDGSSAIIEPKQMLANLI